MGGSEGTGRTLGRFADDRTSGRSTWRQGELSKHKGIVKTSGGTPKRRKEHQSIGRNTKMSEGIPKCRKECQNIERDAKTSEGMQEHRKEHQNVGRSEGALGSAAWDQTTRKTALQSSQRIGGLLERYNQSQGYSDHMSNTWNDVLQ